jgi:hypothetical protein
MYLLTASFTEPGTFGVSNPKELAPATEAAAVPLERARHPRDVLADNLNRMIDRDLQPGAKRSVRAWALSKGLDVRMVDRVSKASHGISLDTLHAISLAVGIEPWRLLLEGSDVAQTQHCAVVGRTVSTIYLAVELQR